jgi:hypothetical protein
VLCTRCNVRVALHIQAPTKSDRCTMMYAYRDIKGWEGVISVGSIHILVCQVIHNFENLTCLYSGRGLPLVVRQSGCLRIPLTRSESFEYRRIRFHAIRIHINKPASQPAIALTSSCRWEQSGNNFRFMISYKHVKLLLIRNLSGL